MIELNDSEERLLYVIPGEKAKVGKSGSCWAFIKGNQKPQKQFQNVDTYLQNWLQQKEEVYQKKTSIEYLSTGANGVGRGKVFLVPNGQILFPVPILSGKGNTGYVSLSDIKGVSGQSKEDGLLLFEDGEQPLLTAEKAVTLYDKLCNGKSRFCEGFSPADFIWEMQNEREKLQWELQNPLTDKASFLQIEQCLLTVYLEHIQGYSPEEQARIARDTLRKMHRMEGWSSKNGITMVALQQAFIQRCLPIIPTKEEERRIVALAQNPDQLLPVEELVARAKPQSTYWSASYAGNQKAKETDRLSPGQTLHVVSDCDTLRMAAPTEKEHRFTSGKVMRKEDISHLAFQAFQEAVENSPANQLAEAMSNAMNQNRELVETITNVLKPWGMHFQAYNEVITKMIEPMKPIVGALQNLGKIVPEGMIFSEYMTKSMVQIPDMSHLTGLMNPIGVDSAALLRPYEENYAILHGVIHKKAK